ncbi:TPA: hypothetical protein HA235_01930 [Candidatus Woesearchaeota archaeon]|nr:hypothetical protein [Candidatus Woesearchaeota archaeon]HIH31444.1 hypothetical protein [Candidatus Woesearchaeota archaeon]HIH54229.1 hypothetical protein [Candidatus Woesearchaeota archaeon]HIJ02204.1 hypothetical protein [Candidatus Woesearchaeota archaeon]HIJ13923.1 hypothetical protein [Candidatus Woesearchaeota archaeon]
MVKIDVLFEQGMISKISELEKTRYINFFTSSYKDNLQHSKYVMSKYPRWSIISGYYAIHDLTKLLLAKNFGIKVDLKVHTTTIIVLKDLVKNKQLINLLDKGHKEFLSLANDLADAKRERVKAQYYTGSEFMHRQYLSRAKEFHESIVLPYIERMKPLIK